MVWIRLYLDCLKFSVDCHVRSAELCDVNVLAVEFVNVTTANIDPSALFLQVRSYWQNEVEERFTSQAEQIIGHFVSHAYRLVSRIVLNQNQASLSWGWCAAMWTQIETQLFVNFQTKLVLEFTSNVSKMHQADPFTLTVQTSCLDNGIHCATFKSSPSGLRAVQKHRSL